MHKHETASKEDATLGRVAVSNFNRDVRAYQAYTHLVQGAGDDKNMIPLVGLERGPSFYFGSLSLAISVVGEQSVRKTWGDPGSNVD